MLIAAGLKKLLDKHRLNYRILRHKRINTHYAAASLLHIDLHKVLCAQVLADRHGKLLFVYPAGCQIDFAKCAGNLRRNLKALPPIEVNRIFADCEENCWPPVGHPYGLEVVLDKRLKKLSQVYFASGSQTALVQMPMTDYFILNARAKILDIATERPEAELCIVQDLVTKHNLILPQLSPVALQILQLSMKGQEATTALAELITADPAIQQHILIYTQLPFIRDKQASALDNATNQKIQDVVDHILGFETVSHIALGVLAGRAFAVSATDLKEFWRHALHAALYAEAITELAPKHLKLDPTLSYMAGLFHNFGLLLFSQMFAPEYSLLKKWQRINPTQCISKLEQRLLGMGQAFNVVRGGHAQLGEWLLRFWGMPEAICVITKEHHSTTYNGEHRHYVRIIQLTNQLLRHEGIGDGAQKDLDQAFLDPLEITVGEVLDCVARIKTHAVDVDNMARSLTNSKEI